MFKDLPKILRRVFPEKEIKEVIEKEKLDEKEEKPEKELEKEISHYLSELNEKQREAVLSEAKRILVLAGAGAGKTKTIIQKILYLLSEKHINPGNILAITFTRNAANEMMDRLILAADENYKNVIFSKTLSKKERNFERTKYLKKYAWLNALTVRTFHSVCLAFLKKYGAKEFDNKFKILMDNSYDLEVNLKAIAPETPNQILYKIILKKCEDVNFLLKLKRYILDHYVDSHSKMHELGKINYKAPYTTLNRDKVRSKSERDIADWLYRHRIKYEYEPIIAPVDFEFKPDFFIPEANLYLEHVSNLSHPLKDKEKQMRLAGKTYVKINEELTQDSSLFNQELERIIVPLIDRDLEKITALNFTEEFRGYEGYLNKFIFEIIGAIGKIKIEDVNLDEIYKKAKKDPHKRIRNFYELFEKLFEGYNNYCINNSYLDFNDLISRTVSLLKKDEKIRKIFQKKFKFILVDEFQDVNTLQVNFLKLLLDKENQLFCVGDDWQSIYGWRGSNVKYIIDFNKFFKNGEMIKLNVNYRCNNTIVCASNEVIKKNKHKIDKKIKAFNSEGKKIYLYNSQNESEDGVETVLEKVKQFLNNGHSKEDILVLTRTRKANSFQHYYDELGKLGIKITTIHSAKGLEAKIVFILGLTGRKYGDLGGFPLVFGADRIMQIIKPVDYELLMEEERRLFYVALTRAKEELFLISEIGNESEFISDIPGEFIDRKNFLMLNVPKQTQKQCFNCKKGLEIEFICCPYCGEGSKENKPLLIKSDYMEKTIEEHPSAYSPWTPKEEKRLKDFFDQGVSINNISKILNRNVGGIRARLKKLGGVKLDNEKTSFNKSLKDKEEIILTPEGEKLFENLRKVRSEFAKIEGYSPYVISHDSTLKQMAGEKPRNKKEILSIKGFGEKKFEKYGKRFLEVIDEFN
jgi:DNA helicase IV